MVKVLHSPLVKKGQIYNGKKYEKDADAMVIYHLKENKSGIELSFTVWPEHNTTYKAILNYEEYAGEIIEISLVTTDKINDLKIYPIYKTVAQTSFLQNQSVSDMRIARVVFDEKCENVVVLLCKDSENIEGVKNFVFDRTKQSAAGFLALHSKYFAERLRKRKIKAVMINDVDIYASISYLEAQVDLLTRVVLSLAPESELKNLLEWADSYSVLDVKPRESIMNEFRKDKAMVRELQRRYYSAKRTV